MKIAYILNTYPQPSHSFIRRELAAIEALGFEVTRFAMRAADVDLVDDLDKAEARKTRYVLNAGMAALLAAVIARALSHPAAMWTAIRAAMRMGARSEAGRLRHLIYLAEAAYVARACAVDQITHCHAHFGTNAAAVAMLCRLMGGPAYSFTVHGPEEFDAPRALSLGDKIRHAKFTVAISAFGRSQLCRWADASDWDRIKVVHCGIDPAVFDAPAPLPDGPPQLVAIGRFVEQKGQMTLVPVMQRIQQAHPGAHLTLIGGGPMGDDLKTAATAAGLSGAITFAGWQNEAGVRRALARSHALIMPSFAEGLPMVVMEAMAAARPVIATYIAGTPELVQDGKTGWLVPAGDTAAMVAAIDAVSAATPAKLAKMGKAGRARVLARHDVGTEAGKLAGYFRESA